jgi:hypothetical protein
MQRVFIIKGRSKQEVLKRFASPCLTVRSNASSKLPWQKHFFSLLRMSPKIEQNLVLVFNPTNPHGLIAITGTKAAAIG